MRLRRQLSFMKRKPWRGKKFTKDQITLYAIYGGIALVIGVFLFVTAAFLWYSRDLPEPGKIQRSKGFSTTFLDRNDEVIFDIFQDQNRIPTNFTTLPECIKQATVAIEDKSFYKHKGFSVTGIARAFVNTIFRGRREGGSTLTQQLVKNVLLSSERTLTRKIKEFVLSTEIERKFTKDEILEMYLNESPYGGTFWGIESASKGYFGKSAKDLNLTQCAVLAGLPQRPSTYSPFIGEKDAYKTRTKDVLRRMREDKYITKEDEQKALKQLESLKFSSAKSTLLAPHFVFYVRDQIVEEFGESILDEGITVKTTLDRDVQAEAEKIVNEEIEKIASSKATNGSAVVLDSETSEILAMVGSYDYNDDEFGKYNTAIALRQPGSALKPITYSVALQQGYTASTVVMDVSTQFPNQGERNYTPGNYDGTFRGPVQLRFALANSINVPAVKLLAMVGIKEFLQTASDMGLDTFAPIDANIKRFGLAVTLGGGETRLLDLTNAYSVYAKGGMHQEHSSIIEIKNFKGKSLFKKSDPKPKRVLDESVSFIISHILSDNIARAEAFGTRSSLHVPNKTVAVKTGTTNDIRDNWTVGFTTDVTVGVWVGNNDNSPMNSAIVSGTTGAAPIWNRLMLHMLGKAGYDDGIIEKPDDVEALQVDSFLGGLPREGYPTRSEYFVKGTTPTEVSSFYQKVKISKNETDKLANDLEIKLGDYDEKDCIVIEERDPVSSDGTNRWQEAINAWLQSQPDEKFKCPTETSSAKADDISVRMQEPRDKSKIDSNSIKIKAKLASSSDIRKVEIKVNGEVKKTIDGNNKDIDETIDLPDGTYEINVRAENVKGKVGESGVRIGVKREWDEKAPTPVPTSAPPPPTPTPTEALPIETP